MFYCRLFNNGGGMVKLFGPGTKEAPLSGLPPIAPLPTAAERAADLIRQYIFEGRFAPGMPLPEAGLSAALQVSRNTVRESFRTLIGEHLLIHEPHKGVTVRWLSPDDAHDIYKLRRMFELSALDLLIQGQEKLGKDELDAIGKTVTEAGAAAANGDWAETGTANLRFHALLVGLHRSERINDTFRRLMTEMRLGFLAHDDPAAFHDRFLARNRALYERMAAGELTEARRELASYLDDAEDDVLRAVAS
jgi:DNA-binding GntR family transcriptional regulator